jgi:serine/threonine-protein kinase
VAVGAAVTVHLSSHNMGAVPNVFGQSEAEAKANLRNAGFTSVRAVTQVVDNAAQVGTVTGQDPAQGVVKKFSTTVKIFVGTPGAPASPSAGPPSVPPSSPAA